MPRWLSHRCARPGGGEEVNCQMRRGDPVFLVVSVDSLETTLQGEPSGKGSGKGEEDTSLARNTGRYLNANESVLGSCELCGRAACSRARERWARARCVQC